MRGKRGLARTIIVVACAAHITLALGCANGRRSRPFVPDGSGRIDGVPVSTLMGQARHVQKQYPELYGYLAERDRATEALVQSYVRAIPHPDNVPDTPIPFIDAVVKVLHPQERCAVCDPENDSFPLLSEELRAKLCHICRHGIYVKGTGIRTLAP